MQIITTSSELIATRENLQGSVALVPTMGALHAGHLSLIRNAKTQNENVIVSIFVNPTQFCEGEDFERYPRKSEADINICQKAGVDILFMPSASEIYQDSDEILLKAPKIAGYTLEGATRAGHFDGVLRVVLKLINLTRAKRAYFGQKDAQQLLLIQKMVRELFVPCEIIPCPIVRDKDGLALSSRNLYLDPSMRNNALKLSESLREVARQIMIGEKNTEKLKAHAMDVLAGIDVEYIEIVDKNLRQREEVKKGETIVLLTARVGGVRLIDNLWI
ncbi:MAG: pantoate--beta-alanine ligase [Wolinella sp.]